MSSLTDPKEALKAQELCLDTLRMELDEIVHISLNLSKSLGFLKSRLKTPFPRKCTKCARIFETFEDFYKDTSEIARGTVNYPILGNDFYLHRNCPSPCETTLVVVFVDRRDDSLPGLRRRLLFETCMNRLRQVLHIPREQARDILLTELANQLTIRTYLEAEREQQAASDS